MESDVLVDVQRVSKKFCRDLKKSLWYGIKDVVTDMNPWQRRSAALPVAPSGSDLRPAEFWAVNDVSFQLRRGECLGLIGHNGAGKTTLLKMLNGLIKPDHGSITMRGRVSALIALGAGFNPILTGRENVYVNGAILGLSKKEIDEQIDGIIDFAEIAEFIDSPVQSYSSGMQVRLGFAVATAMKPDVMILDEVLAVGDVSFQAKCFNTLAEFRERGTAFILVSHNMHQIARYSTQVLYLKKGKTQFGGETDGAIEHFLRDMGQAEFEAVHERTDWSTVYGSGKIAFTAGRFRDGNGVEVTTIEAGAAVTLEIDYKRNADLQAPPVLDVVMRDRDGILFQGTNAMSGVSFGALPKCGSFHVSFPSMPFNSDYVEFFFSVLDSKTSEIFDWKRHVRLNLGSRGVQLGRVLLPVNWGCLAGAE
ncbi:ABC transporter ATP-binding protein [Prosthecobacter sp.]|uniref:ABC transporter ATP-binding protein n=1 Tax=Prosthecobacter sp. TaxID=1965333 RepID=UPI0031F316D8